MLHGRYWPPSDQPPLDVDGIDDPLAPFGSHTFHSSIIGGPGAYIPFPNHSMLCYLGPQVYMLLMDGRAERRKNQVCSGVTYDRIFAAIKTLPRTVEHLVFLLGTASSWVMQISY